MGAMSVLLLRLSSETFAFAGFFLFWLTALILRKWVLRILRWSAAQQGKGEVLDERSSRVFVTVALGFGAVVSGIALIWPIVLRFN